MKEHLTRFLYEENDEEILKRMPEWFRILREARNTKLD